MTLKEYMKSTGTSTRKLSELAGVSTSTIRNARAGGQPRVGAALRIHWATWGRVSLEALGGLTEVEAMEGREACLRRLVADKFKAEMCGAGSPCGDYNCTQAIDHNGQHAARGCGSWW